MKKVLVAMSGGVDSSVSALLLKDGGFDVAGITMSLGFHDEALNDSQRCGHKTIEDAKIICDELEIPHHIMDLSEEFEDKVISNFLDEYAMGRTPNPCVECNKFIKFGILLERSLSLNFDYLATGHYANIENTDGKYYLKRPKDRTKDQTYFLYPVKYDFLKSILFPINNLTKDEVFRIASKANLHVANKPQSQDICFIPEKNYRGFIEKRISGIKPGPIVDLNGKKIGEHKGIIYYTIGQRGGMGISAKNPLYVISIDPSKNEITAGEKQYLKAKGLFAGKVNLLVDELPQEAYAKIRYAHNETKCKISFDNNRLMVIFDKKQEAITPGQSVVLYSNDAVLCGGVIEEVIR